VGEAGVGDIEVVVAEVELGVAPLGKETFPGLENRISRPSSSSTT
jgi:hypothetical protein